MRLPWYNGLDRYGRVVDQRWLDPTSGTATDRFQYAYDLVSNRTSRDNLVNSAFGELYAYDDLSQLVSFQRGTLNGTKTGLTGSASRSQSWDTDAVGNFDSVTTDGTTQTRSANRQNQITSISGATTPTYDDNGNMTGDETGRQFVYDAWNRLVIVKNSVGTTLETFKYDGLNRRVSSSDGTTVTDLYYSSDWQVLSEKVGGTYTKRYVWSPVYVDAMVIRDRDTDSNGTLDERLWVQQDANWNVTALVNGSGAVVECYAYDPYGVRTVYDASYTARTGGSSYDFAHGFQGMWFDVVAGLNPQRERWYRPTLGVWVTMDPIGFEASDVVLYRALGNNPINALDPRGLDIHDNPLVKQPDGSWKIVNQGQKKPWVAESLLDVELEISKAVSQYLHKKKVSLADANTEQLMEAIAEHFRVNPNRFLYTKKGGWIDMLHFMKAATKAKLFRAVPSRLTIDGVIGYGIQLEKEQAEKNDPSGFSFDDLPSNYFGTNFSTHFDRDTLNRLRWDFRDYVNDTLGGFDLGPNYKRYNGFKNFSNDPILRNDTLKSIKFGDKFIFYKSSGDPMIDHTYLKSIAKGLGVELK